MADDRCPSRNQQRTNHPVTVRCLSGLLQAGALPGIIVVTQATAQIAGKGENPLYQHALNQPGSAIAHLGHKSPTVRNAATAVPVLPLVHHVYY